MDTDARGLARGSSRPPRSSLVPYQDLMYRLAVSFFCLASAGFGNPVPEEVMIATAGGYAASTIDEYGMLRWLFLPTVLVGGVVADVVLYMLGRVFGAR